VVASYAFLARTDDLADQGPLRERLTRWQAWSEQVTVGLESGQADDPVLRAFLHTVAARRLPHHWVHTYLKATTEEPHFRCRCRSFAEGLQRLDFLTDLTDDLTEGRRYLPQGELDRFGVTRADLEQGQGTPAVAELVAETCRRTRMWAERARERWRHALLERGVLPYLRHRLLESEGRWTLPGAAARTPTGDGVEGELAGQSRELPNSRR
jgi:phytoene synthase